MKIQFKNLVGELEYLPHLQIYVAEFVVNERHFSFSGENKMELYKHISKDLEPYISPDYFNINLFGETTGKAMTLPC